MSNDASSTPWSGTVNAGSNKDEVDVTTDVLIVGAGPAGASLACFLGYNGVKGIMISRASTTSPQPRAHVTNPASFECLREIGLEAELRDVSLKKEYYGDYRFCRSLLGEDLARAYSISVDQNRLSDYANVSPCVHADISQNAVEPILLKYATQHGIQSRFDCKLLDYVQDSSTGRVISTVKDEISGKSFRISSRFLCGADGAGSVVARIADLPYNTTPAGGLALNVWFEADLHDAYRLNPGMLHMILTPELESPEWGVVGINRVVRPYSEFVMGLLASPTATSNDVTEEGVKQRLRELIGDPNLEMKIKGIYKWKINEAYAEVISRGNVFCLGDAIHRHPPGNGLGSNTCIQDAYNLAWKLAYVLQGKAGPDLLETYNLERQPVGQRVVKVANDTIRILGRLVKVLGVFEGERAQRLRAVEVMSEDSEEGKRSRKELREAIEAQKDETTGLGGEMNQKYASSAVRTEDESDKGPVWEGGSHGIRNHVISTYPGSRLPHAWLGTKKAGVKYSTHDLAGHGEFTLFTGVGGRSLWAEAAAKATSNTNLKVNVVSIGPGQDYSDMYYMWEDRRGVEEDGAVLVRPDRTVAWRYQTREGAGKLAAVLRKILSLEE